MTEEEKLKDIAAYNKVKGAALLYKKIGKTKQEAINDINLLYIMDPEAVAGIVNEVYKED